MSQGPLVSIAIPNYNYGRFVQEAVDSALAQTYENIEVVVSDNASEDDSWAKLQAYANHPKVRLYRQEKTLPVGNHFGFVSLMSDAQHIVLFSSDDAMKPEFVERTMRVYLDHPERKIAFVASEREVVDGEGRVSEFPPFYDRSCLVPGDRQAKVFLMGNPFVPSQVLINREFFQPNYQEYKLFRDDKKSFQRLMEVRGEYDCIADCSIWFQLCLKADFGYVREKLVKYRQHFQGEAAANMGNLRGIFELYLMKYRLVEEARHKGKDFIVAFGDEAIRKIGSDCLKWSVMFLEHQDLPTARRLQRLSVVIDESLAQSQTYKALDYVMGSGITDPWKTYQALVPSIGACLRDFSYEPPEGFIPL